MEALHCSYFSICLMYLSFFIAEGWTHLVAYLMTIIVLRIGRFLAPTIQVKMGLKHAAGCKANYERTGISQILGK